MKKYLIATGSVTYALKGRDILRREGFKASMLRSPENIGRYGCGYGILVQDNISEIKRILEEHGIKMLAVNEV